MALNKVEICGVNTSRLPILTNEEKDALFVRIKEGDPEAREQYIKGNLRLVLSVIICGVNTSRLPILTNEEKDALFVRIKEGDPEAREQYIKGNLRLVLSVIKRFSSSN